MKDAIEEFIVVVASLLANALQSVAEMVLLFIALCTFNVYERKGYCRNRKTIP